MSTPNETASPVVVISGRQVHVSWPGAQQATFIFKTQEAAEHVGLAIEADHPTQHRATEYAKWISQHYDQGYSLPTH